MKGLMLRDFYSLKNSLKLFLGVTAGVIVLSVLFILSSKYGNIALGIAEMKQENLGEEVFYSMFQIAIWVVLLLPLAFMTMGVECFKADKQAGFSKVLFSMPVSVSEIVSSRYLSCLVLSFISLTGSLTAGFFISLVSDFFSWTQLFSNIISIFSILFIYSNVLLVFIYDMGVEKSDFIMIISIMVILVCIIAFCINGSSVSEAEYDKVMIEKINFLRDVMTKYCIWLLAIYMGHNFGHGYFGEPFSAFIVFTIYTTGIGAVLYYLTKKTGSVWPAAFMHAANNNFSSGTILSMAYSEDGVSAMALESPIRLLVICIPVICIGIFVCINPEEVKIC